MQKIGIVVVAVAALSVVAALALQQRSISKLSSELAALRQGDAAGAKPDPARQPADAVRLKQEAPNLAGVHQRLNDLEDRLVQLARASDYLMDRGQLPLPTSKLEDVARRFQDTSVPDGDRLRALGLLRRNGGMTDEITQQSLAWLQSSTNAGTRRQLVESLAGLTNPAVKSALVGLMKSEPSNDVREEIAEGLRRHAADPSVQSALWDAAMNDKDGDVRDEAREALRDGPVSAARIEELRSVAANPQASLDEQLLALDVLRRSKTPVSDIVANLAQLAQATQDPWQRTRLFEAFDEIDDPSTKLPLVYGLQDPNPLVREEAADALSRHSSDPAVREWLQHIANNDADPKVRREAFQALQERRR